MSEQPVVLENPDQNTVALIFSWLNQNSENDQDAEVQKISPFASSFLTYFDSL